ESYFSAYLTLWFPLLIWWTPLCRMLQIMTRRFTLYAYTQLNRGEGRHAVARAICYGQRGEIRKRYREGQEDQLGALGLVTNAVVLWNTLYMQEALSHLRSAGEIPEDEHISRLSPLMYGHINMLGHYTFTLPENILKGELRPLNFNSNNELLP
ncbi:Tn3 family transposase, partial [Klebsiella pneumoniae]|uniref:Tn3 family transposase n=2 Tax=Klebsiella pneumoniae TaxID=573 RepID=UPI00350FCB0F